MSVNWLSQPELIEPLTTLIHALEYCDKEFARHTQRVMGYGWYHNGSITLRGHIADKFLKQKGQ